MNYKTTFKCSANIICTFINVCKTLAYCHQSYSLCALLSGQHNRTISIPGIISVSLLKSSIYCDLLLKATSCETTNNLALQFY